MRQVSEKEAEGFEEIANPFVAADDGVGE